MKNHNNGLFGMAILFWLGMFSVFLFQEKGQMSPLLIGVACMISLIGGILFAGFMSLFIKFAIRYSGANLVTLRRRTKVERLISLLSLPFAAAPIVYALTYEEDFLWPILLSSIPAFLLFSPLMSKAHSKGQWVTRTVLSFIGCICVALFIYQCFVVESLSVPSRHAWIVSVVNALSCCISYLLSLHANRSSASFTVNA